MVAAVSVFHDARVELAGKLTAAGIERVTLDPTASPPFVLVGPHTGDGSVGVGGWSITVPITVAVPPPADAPAYVFLADVVEAICRTIGWIDHRPTTYTLGTTELPAYELPVALDVTNPDC
jgi:hypothetical protein